VFLLTLCLVHGAWAGPPTDQLRERVDRVVKILKDPELAGDKKADERRAAISTVANEIFDFAETAKRSLGRHWAQRTSTEREEFVHLFTELVAHVLLPGGSVQLRDDVPRRHGGWGPRHRADDAPPR
jgi:phospholipid transport system substrate-binding protein